MREKSFYQGSKIVATEFSNVIIIEDGDFKKVFEENDRFTLEEEMYERYVSATKMDTLYHKREKELKVKQKILKDALASNFINCS